MSEPKVPQTCEGCGVPTIQYTSIHVTNGLLTLCRTCLDDVNRKNPALAALESENQSLRADNERLREEIELPRCNSCCMELGDNWCADCAGAADRYKAEQLQATNTRLEAEAAALKTWLAQLRQSCSPVFGNGGRPQWVREIDQLLASDAGSSFLRRLQDAERQRDEHIKDKHRILGEYEAEVQRLRSRLQAAEEDLAQAKNDASALSADLAQERHERRPSGSP